MVKNWEHGLGPTTSRESVDDHETDANEDKKLSVRRRLTAAAASLSITLPPETPYEALTRSNELLGEGTSSRVYSAILQDNTVALKCLKTTFVTPKGHRHFDYESFAAEVSRTANLNSPHVVKFIGYTAEPCCLMLEYMSGGTLAEYLGRHRPDLLEWEKRMMIAQDIIQGIAYIHRMGIVHRDIKSTNILMQDDKAKIADFGTEFSCGTFAYMAPELFSATAEEQESNSKVDIYAFAIVLWELVSHAVPLAGVKNTDRNKNNILAHIQIPDGTPVVYKHLITQSWQRDPEKRPTADALANELNALTITPDEVADWKARRKQ